MLTSESTKGQTIHITVSIGVAISSPRIDDIKRLVREADDALYRAQQEGRNRVVFQEVNYPRAVNLKRH